MESNSVTKPSVANPSAPDRDRLRNPTCLSSLLFIPGMIMHLFKPFLRQFTTPDTGVNPMARSEWRRERRVHRFEGVGRGLRWKGEWVRECGRRRAWETIMRKPLWMHKP